MSNGMEKILEFCGLRKEMSTAGYKMWFEQDGTIVSPTDSVTHEPVLDMNFFFQYVVPKLTDRTILFREMGDNWHVVLGNAPAETPITGVASDPNLAWQSALEKLIEHDEVSKLRHRI